MCKLLQFDIINNFYKNCHFLKLRLLSLKLYFYKFLKANVNAQLKMVL